MFARAQNVWRDCEKVVKITFTTSPHKASTVGGDDDPIDEQAAIDIETA